MSDLISRSALINKIRGIVPGSQTVDFIVGLIENQPTAYDVDAVVEETDNVLHDLNVIEILSHFEPDSTIQNHLENFLDSFKTEILRIVRKGGVKNDTSIEN